MTKSISQAHIWLCTALRCEVIAALLSDNDLFESSPGVSYRRSLSLSLSLSLRASLNAYELPDRVYKELVNFPFPPSNHPLFDLRHVMRLR